MTGCQENKSCSKVLNFLERLDDRIRCTHKETVAVVKPWKDVGSNKSLGCVFSKKPADVRDPVNPCPFETFLSPFFPFALIMMCESKFSWIRCGLQWYVERVAAYICSFLLLFLLLPLSSSFCRQRQHQSRHLCTAVRLLKRKTSKQQTNKKEFITLNAVSLAE